MTAALIVEWWKLRRSPVVVIATALMVLVVPALGLATMQAATGAAVGPLAAKTDALLTADGWPGYAGVVAQVAAAALFVGAGVVVAWIFGREHAERTYAGLFAAAVSRRDVAAAKLVLVAAWGGAVAVLVTLATAGAGAVADVGPQPMSATVPDLLRLLVVAGATTMLAIPVGYVASVGRGYLPAIGAVVVVLAVSQVSVLLGQGASFPFAVPGLLAVGGAAGVPPPTPLGVTLAVATVLVGAVATLRWWARSSVV